MNWINREVKEMLLASQINFILHYNDKIICQRNNSLNNEAQNRRQAFFQIILGCHIPIIFLPEDCAELSTNKIIQKPDNQDHRST